MPGETVSAISQSLVLAQANASRLTDTIIRQTDNGLGSIASVSGGYAASLVSGIDAAEVSPAGLIDDIVEAIRRWIRDRLRELQETIGGWISNIVGKIGEFINGIFTGIGGFINRIVTSVRDAIESVAGAIRNTITSLVNAVRDFATSLFNRIRDIVDSIRDGIASLVNRITTEISRIVNSLQTGIASLVNQISGTISNLVNVVRTGLENLVNRIRDLTTQIASIIGTAVANAVRDVGTFIGRIVDGVRAGFQTVVNAVLTTITNLVISIRDRVTELVNTVLTVAGNIVNGVRTAIETAFASIRAEGERILTGVRDFIQRLIAEIIRILGEIIQRATQAAQAVLGFANETVLQPFFEFTRALQASIMSKAQIASSAIRGGYGDAGKLMSDLFAPLANIPPAANISGWLLAAAFVAGTMPFVAGDAFEAIRQNLRASLSVVKVDPTIAVQAAVKGGISRDLANSNAASFGLGASQQGILYAAAREILAAGELLEATNRGHISEEYAKTSLQQRGYTAGDASTLLQLRFQIPGVQDLVRFMVREAFNDQVVRQFGYDEDFPEQILQWTRKQGLSDEFTKAYWRAHWDLPSPSQGFEMLHRDVIDMPTLLTLLKVADYPVFWREKLAAISYNPITRVDIRRMYRTGVLSREQVSDRYRAIGYTPEDAALLTEFTVKYEHTELENTLDRLSERNEKAVETAYARGNIDRDTAKRLLVELGFVPDVSEQILALVDFEKQVRNLPDETPEFRQITSGLIRNAYSDRAIDRKQAFSQLVTVGWSEQDAEFLLSLEDYDRLRKLRNARVGIETERYVEKQIEEHEFIRRLGTLELPADEISLIVQDAQLARERKVKRLTEATLARLLKLNVIGEAQYIEELQAYGYSQKQIEWLLASRIVPS